MAGCVGEIEGGGGKMMVLFLSHRSADYFLNLWIRGTISI
jgi:hypothetical protein